MMSIQHVADRTEIPVDVVGHILAHGRAAAIANSGMLQIDSTKVAISFMYLPT